MEPENCRNVVIVFVVTERKVDLRNRPLRATRLDARLRVERHDDEARIERALFDLGFNVIVLGRPGSGITSLVNLVVRRAEDERRPVVRVSLRRATTLAEALDVLSYAASEDAEPVPAPRPRENDAVGNAYRRLAQVVREHTIFVLDDVPAGTGHELFGRMRDELWNLDAQWLVTAALDDAAALLAPPAEAFFELVHTVGPMSDAQIRELLERRDPDGAIPDPAREWVVRVSGGSPARAVTAATSAMIGGPDGPAGLLELGNEPPTAQGGRARSLVGEQGARLLDELARTGPTSATDKQLLAQLGVSASRAYQLLAHLEAAGLVTSANERSGRPGRPRKLYRVVDGR